MFLAGRGKLFLEGDPRTGAAGFNDFLTSQALRLINAPGKRRSRLREFMILFIIIGLALILGVNWLYTRFGENPASGRRQ